MGSDSSGLGNSGLNSYNWSRVALAKRSDVASGCSAYFLYFTDTNITTSNGATYR